MGIGETMGVAMKVVTDWRVIAITVTVLLLLLAFRYVGSIYHRRSKFVPPPPAPPTKVSPSTAASRSSAARGGRSERTESAGQGRQGARNRPSGEVVE